MNSDRIHEYRLTLNQRLEQFLTQEKALSPDEEQRLVRAVEQFLATINDLEAGHSQSSEHSTVIPKLDHPATKPLFDILNVVPNGHLVTSPNGIIHMANRQGAQLLDIPDQLLPNTSIISFFEESERAHVQSNLQGLAKGATNLTWEIQLSPRHYPPCLVSCTMSALRDMQGELVSIHWLFQDLTDQQRAEMTEELVTEIGEQVLAGLSLDQVLSLICRRLVETFDYPLIWVGTKELNGTIRIRAQAGNYPYIPDHHPEHWDDTAEGHRAADKAIRLKATQLIGLNDPDRGGSAEYLRLAGFRSGLAIPLYVRDQVLGVLTVYGHGANDFAPEVIQWLEKLAAQISMTLFVVQDYDKLRLHGAALTSAEHAVCITDSTGCVEWVNDAYSRLTGYAPAELIGKSLSSILSGQVGEIFKEGQFPLTEGQCWKDESIEQRKDGSTFMVEQQVTPLLNDHGKLTNFVVVIQDITVRKHVEKQMRHRAYHDPLTDLPNRIMFEDRLKQALAQARRSRRLVSVMFIDLDQFKEINDGYGHQVGDELLKTVGRRLKHCVRATDTVARLSGDEFTLILQDLDQIHAARHVAQKILECVAQPVRLGDQDLLIGASIGIAVYPLDGSDADELLHCADQAMYKAKQLGGQSCWFASENYNSLIQEYPFPQLGTGTS